MAIVQDDARVHTLAEPWRAFTRTYWPPGPDEGGGKLYRPLGSLAFAAQWVAGGGSPAVFHALNLLLYVAVTLAVWALARRLVSPPAAAVAAALFAVHPVHVEASANVVGQLELLAGLALVGCTVAWLRWRDGHTGREPPRPLLGAVVALGFAAGCLAKDNAIMLPGLLLAAEWLLVRDVRPPAARARAVLPALAVVAALGVAYLAARAAVTGSLAGDPPVGWLLELGTAGRLSTMLAVVPEWVRLLAWPAHLSAFYSPRTVTLHTDPWAPAPLLGLLLLVAAIVAFGLAVRADRRVAFALAWLGITLFPVSNTLVISGIALAERTLFAPSVGAVLLAGVAAERALRWGEARPGALRLLGLATALVVAAGALWSARRATVWADNRTLFARSVADAPESSAAWWAFAGQQFQDGKFGSGEAAMRRAIALYGRNPRLLEDLAARYHQNRLCGPAVELYRQALDLYPTRYRTRLSLINCLGILGDTAGARREAREGIRLGAGRAEFEDLLRRNP